MNECHYFQPSRRHPRRDWWAIAREALETVVLALFFVGAIYLITGFIYVVGA